MRHLAVALLLAASPCFAQSESQPESPLESPPAWETADRTAFVRTGDACGANTYRYLEGQSYLLHGEALPPGAIIRGPVPTGVIRAAHRRAATAKPITLEYRAQRLNVVLDSAGRIVAIACH